MSDELINKTDREALYEAMQRPEPEVSPEKEIADDSPVDESTEKTEVSPEEEITDDSPAEESTEEDVPKVPIHALHEEREMHKATRKRVSELENRVNMLIKDNEKLLDRLDAPKVNLEDMDPQEREIYELKQTVKRLERGQTQNAQQSVKSFQEEVDTLVAQVDKELSEEGFPGFAVARYALAQKCRDEALSDEEFLNPKILKRIYKEQIFPGLQKQFDAGSRKGRIADKEARKKNAKLAGNPGRKTKESQEKPKSTFDDYLQRRRYIE